MRKASSIANVLLSSEKRPDEKKEILNKDFDIPMSVKMSKEVQTMCNLGEGLYEQAYEKAYEEAYEEAYEKAYVSADKERAVAIAKKMLERGKYAIEEIAEDTGLTIEEIEQLSNLQPV